MNTPTRPGPSVGIPSPHTPQRGISSTYSSPGIRADDDTIILELGTRYLRAGLVNDSAPRCSLEFGPEESRRLGDYRKWLPGYEDRARVSKSLETWTKDHELWQLDIRDTDLGLMQDKLERAIRKAFAEYLLIDAKSRKVVLVVQTIISHLVLSRILNLMFTNFQISSVTLLPPPIVAVVAAGQRSGLVVDIGWHETVITAVYELREVKESRSARAMKLLSKKAVQYFEDRIQRQTRLDEADMKTKFDFEYVEELITQCFWCQPASTASLEHRQAFEPVDTKISLPLPLPSSAGFEIPFSALSGVVEDALFAQSTSRRYQDDHEQNLSYLIYHTLLHLAPDTRSVCMSKIMFIGGGANIPGLKFRILDDIEAMVKERGWSQVWPRARSPSRSVSSTDTFLSANGEITTDRPDSMLLRSGAAFETQVKDVIEEKIRITAAKSTKKETQGVIRGVETMGAFAGASLTTALRIKSRVEIERELFLQYGLSGPGKERDSLTSRPKSFGGVYAKLPTAESSTWTLGAFA